MEIDVAWTAAQVDPASADGSTVLVIDVLRATTMIAGLLAAGAREVWPVTEVSSARALAGQLGTGTLLAGEREGLAPDGFDMGNSPATIDSKQVSGRRVVITTTNGTQAINRCPNAKRLATAAFVNAHAVLSWTAGFTGERLYVVCAGTGGRFSLDDALCAGMVIARLSDVVEAVKSDGAIAAQGLYERYARELSRVVGGCLHAKELRRLNLGDDVDFALRPDVLDVVPVRVEDGMGCRLVAS